jgi:hypothetical protein
MSDESSVMRHEVTSGRPVSLWESGNILDSLNDVIWLNPKQRRRRGINQRFSAGIMSTYFPEPALASDRVADRKQSCAASPPHSAVSLWLTEI